MAEETPKQTTTMSTTQQQHEEVTVTDVSVSETEDNHQQTPPQPTHSSSSSSSSPAPPSTAENEGKGTVDETAVEKVELIEPPKMSEIETNGTGDDGVFSEQEENAVAELKILLQNAIHGGEFTTATVDEATQTPTEEKEAPADEPAVVLADQPQEESEPTKPAAKCESEPQELEEVKKISIDEDGTKTVEAIEETVVSVVPSSPPTAHQPSEPEPKPTNPSHSFPLESIILWGIPLLQDDRTDTILWKFLRARDFKVKDAFAMLKNTLLWRREFGVDDLVDQEIDEVDFLGKAAFMHGVTKEGHPVCYNVYGVFQDKELYQKTFSDEKKREKFLKWRVQLMEKSVRRLDFRAGGVSTIVQVNDLKDSPGPGKWELRQATKQALQLFQDNYPEFVAKQVFINVPWWYMAVSKMISPFLTQRTKSKFVVAGPSKSAETLFNYIAPEQVPVQYGGLSREGEFGTNDGATQIIVKPTSKEIVEFAVTEACCDLRWEVRVLGWEVSYGAEFVPSAKDGYTVIIQKIRKVNAAATSQDHTIITNSFKTTQPGKVVLTIHNSSSKKKRLLYRLKSIPSSL